LHPPLSIAFLLSTPLLLDCGLSLSLHDALPIFLLIVCLLNGEGEDEELKTLTWTLAFWCVPELSSTVKARPPSAGKTETMREILARSSATSVTFRDTV